MHRAILRNSIPLLAVSAAFVCILLELSHGINQRTECETKDESCVTSRSNQGDTNHRQVSSNESPGIDGARLSRPQFHLASATNKKPADPVSQKSRRIEFAAGEMANSVLESLDGKYKTKRPKKVHAALILVLETTHRKRIVLHSLKSKLDKQQFEQACDLLESEKHRFDDLLHRRHQIMRSEDRSAIRELLDYNDIATQLLARQLTGEIFSQVKQASRMAARKSQPDNR